MCPVNKTWIDITGKFQLASSKLSPGLLIHVPSFSLFDAMSAIEIADSKMDATMQWNKLPADYPHSLNEALHNNQLKLQGHTHTELIGIFDEMLACIATWLDGHTLAQTVFTSLYLLEPRQLDDQILCGFSMATVRVIDMMRDVLTKGRVVVEDEQQLVCIGLNMLSSVNDDAILTSLKMAKDNCQRLLKDASPLPNSVQPSADSRSQSQHNPEMHSSPSPRQTTQSTEEVLVRIKFIKSLFSVLTNLKKQTREAFHASEKELPNTLSLLELISSSLHLGQEVDRSDPLKLGFHPLINQHNLPPSYRAYSILSRVKAMALLNKSLRELYNVFEIGKINSISELFTAVANLSSVNTSIGILARSYVSCYCLNNDRFKAFGTKTIEEMIKDELRSLFNPPCLNPRSTVSTTPLVKDIVDRLLGHVHLPFVDMLQLYCHHRSKQRNMIGHYMETVGELQHKLEITDQQLNELTINIDPQRHHNSSISSWFVYYVTKLFVDYLHIGFEYNLYSSFEYHYIFWYLEYSYGWNQMTIKAANKQLLLEPNLIQGKSKKKSKGKKKELPKDKEIELGILQVKRMLCIGLMRTCEALMLDRNRITKPSFEFGSESLIYYNRFLPFTSVLSPHPLTYDDYQQLAGISNYKDATVNLYDAAFRHFESAKLTIETIHYTTNPEMEQLSRVIKTNLVIMKLAASGHKGTGSELPQLDFTLHKDFPVFRL